MGIERSFGRRARAWRRRVGLKLIELSGRTGLHRNYLSDLERGRRNPSLRVIARLAKGLGRDAGELVGTPQKDRRIRRVLREQQRLLGLLQRLEERLAEGPDRETVRRARELAEQTLNDLKGALGKD